MEKLGKQSRDDGLELNFREGFWQPDFGALRRDGVKMVGIKGLERAASIYPANTTMSQDKWPVSSDKRAAAYEALKTVNIVDIDVDEGQARGFAYCYSSERAGQYQAEVEALPATATVDGNIVYDSPEHWSLKEQVGFIFDDDKYILGSGLYYIESTRGDI